MSNIHTKLSTLYLRFGFVQKIEMTEHHSTFKT